MRIRLTDMVPHPHAGLVRWSGLICDGDDDMVGNFNATVFDPHVLDSRDAEKASQDLADALRAVTDKWDENAAPDHVLLIELIEVHHPHRKQGIGKLAAEHILATLGMGCDIVVANVNPAHFTGSNEDRLTISTKLLNYWREVRFLAPLDGDNLFYDWIN